MRYALSPLPVTTYDGRGPPPRPKSFDTNDLRRFPSANTVPTEFQDYFIKSCSAGVDIDDIYCIMEELTGRVADAGSLNRAGPVTQAGQHFPKVLKFTLDFCQTYGIIGE
jgi:hypothetical protein